MKIRFVLTTLVAVVLGVLLSLKASQVTPERYRISFFLGLATLAISLLSPGDQMSIRIGRNGWKRIALMPVIYVVAASPFIVLTEAGFAGYRGFAASMRYVSLTVGIIGLLGLVSSFVIPCLVRRHARKAN
jgi:hypothetical protein